MSQPKNRTATKQPPSAPPPASDTVRITPGAKLSADRSTAAPTMSWAARVGQASRTAPSRPLSQDDAAPPPSSATPPKTPPLAPLEQVRPLVASSPARSDTVSSSTLTPSSNRAGGGIIFPPGGPINWADDPVIPSPVIPTKDRSGDTLLEGVPPMQFLPPAVTPLQQVPLPTVQNCTVVFNDTKLSYATQTERVVLALEIKDKKYTFNAEPPAPPEAPRDSLPHLSSLLPQSTEVGRGATRVPENPAVPKINQIDLALLDPVEDPSAVAAAQQQQIPSLPSPSDPSPNAGGDSMISSVSLGGGRRSSSDRLRDAEAQTDINALNFDIRAKSTQPTVPSSSLAHAMPPPSNRNSNSSSHKNSSGGGGGSRNNNNNNNLIPHPTPDFRSVPPSMLAPNGDDATGAEWGHPYSHDPSGYSEPYGAQWGSGAYSMYAAPPMAPPAGAPPPPRGGPGGNLPPGMMPPPGAGGAPPPRGGSGGGGHQRFQRPPPQGQWPPYTGPQQGYNMNSQGQLPPPPGYPPPPPYGGPPLGGPGGPPPNQGPRSSFMPPYAYPPPQRAPMDPQYASEQQPSKRPGAGPY